MNLEYLNQPFEPAEVEWLLKAGRVMAYISARAVMDRLDEAVGKENWQTKLTELKNGFQCELGIKIADEWRWKSDVSDETDIESTKGAASGALKRAGVQWGIGRYLYDLGEMKPVLCDNGVHSSKDKDGKWFRWNPPELPKWALPIDKTGEMPDDIKADFREKKFSVNAVKKFCSIRMWDWNKIKIDLATKGW